MLFIPPSMPFMDPVPEAEADHGQLPDAITDLSVDSVVRYDPPFSSAIRNKITFSWSAPNDNGSPISHYAVQIHEHTSTNNSHWVRIDSIEDTTYTDTVPYGSQITYRVFAVSDGCHGNTTTYYDTLPCNEGNILSVPSVLDGGIYPPKAGCDNEYLDDCGYWDDETPPVITVPSDQTLTADSASGITFPTGTEISWLSSVTSIDSVTNSTGSYSQQLSSHCTDGVITPYHVWTAIGGGGYGWSSNNAPYSNPPYDLQVIENPITLPVGTTTITCTATDYSGNTASDSFTVTVNYTALVLPTAYLNATSPTGRTLHFADSLSSTSIYNFVTMSKDGSVVSDEFFGQHGNWLIHVFDYYQTPIPIHWEAGTYDIDWYVAEDSGTTSVIIPQVPSGYVPTPTISAYLNATSSTGRTISFTGDDYTGLGIPDINDNYYRATAHIFYNGVDVFADPNGLSASLGWGTWEVYFERGITSYASTTDHWQIPIPENWPAGNYNITWETQWNDYSQSNSGSTTITVPAGPYSDNTSPVVTVPSDQTLTADSASGITFSSGTDVGWLSSVTAIDSVTNSTGSYSQQLFPVCDPSNDLTPSSNSNFGHDLSGWIGSSNNINTITFPVGTTTISCTATDYSGNTASDSFTVTVNYTGSSDETSPVVTVPDDFVFPVDYCSPEGICSTTIEESEIEIHINLKASATDNILVTSFDCGPVNNINGSNGHSVPISPGGDHLFGHSWSSWPEGTTIVTCTATDAAGNEGSESFTITVTSEAGAIFSEDFTFSSDIVLPIVSIDQNTVSNSTSNPAGKIISYTASATDADPPNPSVTCTPPSGSNFPIGPTTITCTATDSAGNEGSASYTVTVVLEGASEPSAPPVSYTAAEQECLSSANLSTTEKLYTVVTCENPFNVTMYMGQRLHIQNPNGGSHNMNPAANVSPVDMSSPGGGTYQYSSDGISGTITLLAASQNQPHATTNVAATMWGTNSQPGNKVDFEMGVKNNNSFSVKNLYVYWHMMYSGSFVGSWQQFTDNDYSATILPDDYQTYNKNDNCCLYSDYNDAIPYIVQAFHVDGTQLVKPNVYPGTWTNADVTPPTPITQNFAITGFANNQGNSGWLHLAIDDSGIYVADRISDNVKKFDFSGNLIFTITDNISNAADIALDSDHNIYLTDSVLGASGGQGSNSIKKFDSDGNYLGVFASVSSVGGIGIDSSGKVYVGSHGTSGYSGQNHVYIFNSNGNQLNAIPVNGFASFYPLAVEPNGTFYISNMKTSTNQPFVVSKYSSSGTFQNYIGSAEHAYQTDGQDAHSGPYCIGASNSKVYVCEQNEGVVKIFDTSGNLEKIIQPLCKVDDNIQCSGTDFALHSFSSPSDVALDSVGNIYIADPNKMRILVLPPNSGQTPGEAAEPAPTLTASAYLNSTSSTGRTLQITASDTDTMTNITFDYTTLSKDGSVVFPTGLIPNEVWNINLCYISCSPYATDYNQISIPTAWEAGVYLISWSASWWDGSESGSTSGTTSVTIPALPPSGPTPTVTASAYLNSTSPTNRTISLTGEDYDFDEDGTDDYYRATAHIFYNGVDVFDDPNGLSASLGWGTWEVYFERPINYWASGIPPGYWQIPIPENWPAGNYNITWETQWNDYSQSNSGSTSVTVPTLPSSDTTPTVTVSAYLNSTSPTNRTIQMIGSDFSEDYGVEAHVYKNGVEYAFDGGEYGQPMGFEWMLCIHESNCLPPNAPNWTNVWQMPIPEDWPGGTYDVTSTVYVWGADDIDVVTDSTSMTVPVLPPDDTATLSVNAYVNGTSPTGRTLHLGVVNPNPLGDAQKFEDVTVTKDGSEFFFLSPIEFLRIWEEATLYTNDYLQIPIPVYWEAGTYDINWRFSYTGDTGVTTVTIPQVSSEYVPTPTVSAYLNATSSTGRTLSFTGDDYTGLGDTTYAENYYRATAHIFYNGVDVFSTFGGWGDVYFERGSGVPISNTKWQIPIPENWPAENYNVAWETEWQYCMFQGNNAPDWKRCTPINTWLGHNSGNTSITIPALPGTEVEEEVEEEVEPEVDETGPELVVSNPFTSITYDPAGRNVSYATPSATDISEPIELSCDYPSGTWLPVGITIVTCTAVDAAGNSTVKSFTITVVHSVEADTDEPVFMQVSDVGQSTTNSDGITYHYAIPQVDDNIGVTVGPTCTPESGSIFPIGTTPVVCTASDAAGNVGTTTFSVTVINLNATSDAPTFEPIDDIGPLEADVPNGKQWYYDIPMATDDETESPVVICTPPPGFLFPVGTITVVCTAIDEDGNQGSVTFTVEISAFIQQQTSDQTADTSITAVNIQETVDGESVPSIPAGGLAYFTTSLATNSTGNAFVTIYVQDADSTALGVGHFKSVIVTGDSDITLGFRMPGDAISGTADVYVNVWSDETDGAENLSSVETNIQIIGVDPTDPGAFTVARAGFPSGIGDTIDGYSVDNVMNMAINLWKNPDNVDDFAAYTMWSDIYGYDVGSYAESKVPFGNDFATDLTFTPVAWNVANLQIHWVKEYGDLFGVAPLSDYKDLDVDVIYVGLGTSETYDGTWQPYPAWFIAYTLAHEMGHVIGFGHDEDPLPDCFLIIDGQANPARFSDENFARCLMTAGDAGTGASFPAKVFGTVELTKEIPGGGSWSIPAYASKDVANFNYHVSTDNEAGFNVYFVPDLETAKVQYEGSQQIDSYPGCFAEDVMSTGNRSCNNVETGSGLFITVPLTNETSGTSVEITVKLQENVDGFQTLSNVATALEAPIMTTATQLSKFELLEVSETEVEHVSVFLDGTNFFEMPDITLAQDTVEFSIVGWIEPDFSKGSQDLTIVSKYESFELFLEKESFQFEDGKMIRVPPTLNFSVYDGTEWYTIQGNTDISEDWHQIAAVVDDSVATLYLDGKFEGKVKLEKDVPLGYSLEAGKCQQASCIIDVKITTSDREIIVGAYVTKKMVKTCCDDDGFITYVPVWTPVDNFTGVISSPERFSGAFSENQILKLYERDKNYFEKDISTNSVSVGTESPALSDSECLDLAKERGLDALVQVSHTLVCQFPFNVVIPLNSSILWIETLSSTGGPYHMMRSVDNLFIPSPALFTLIDFNEPKFTYGVYDYVDDLSDLTGKIIIAKPLESNSKISTLPQGFSPTLDPINVSRGSAGPDCVIDNSCYDPFGVSVDVRKKITWRNIDSFSHTVTSGTPEDGPDGVFDSGLVPALGYFSHTFYETGIYDYYCTFHPWMQGMVVVGEI